MNDRARPSDRSALTTIPCVSRLAGRKDRRARPFRGSKSRNKVSVGEPADGSFPYCVLNPIPSGAGRRRATTGFPRRLPPITKKSNRYRRRRGAERRWNSVHSSERWITRLAGRGRPRRTARRNVNRRTNRSSTSRTHMAPAEKSFAGSSVPGSDIRYTLLSPVGIRDGVTSAGPMKRT